MTIISVTEMAETDKGPFKLVKIFHELAESEPKACPQTSKGKMANHVQTAEELLILTNNEITGEKPS